MTSSDRKARSEAILQKEAIPFLPSLPCIKSEEETELRSIEEVGIRMACLFCVVGSAFEPSETVFKEYLKKYQLWDHLTPDETAFLSNPAPDKRANIEFAWRTEALFVLMWSAGLFEDLPLPTHGTDTGKIVSMFPECDESPWPFIRKLQMRPKSEILDAADLIYRLHWAARNPELTGQSACRAKLHAGVVQEWRHAINWVTNYENLDWDEVKTDT